MRFKLTLTTEPNQQAIIPINYQYELSSWIYKTLHLADPEFSEWLHERGYSYKYKAFKLFTFSKIKIPKRKIEGDRIRILCHKVEMQVSILLEEGVKRLITGLFQDKSFRLGDKQTQAIFRVNTIEALPPLQEKDEYFFETISPICVSRDILHKGKQSASYLSPVDHGYERLFFENLIFKLFAAKKELKEDTSSSEFELTNEPKEKLIRIKAFTPQETFIKAYQFRFRLIAPFELIKVGYYAGFGKENSLGFGCVREVLE